MNRVYLHGVAHVKKSGDTLYIASEGEGVVDEKSVIAAGSDTPRTLADRFGAVVNVKDFGAVGDGVTDDTEAIQKAFDAAGERGINVFFPRSVYGITAPLFIPSEVEIDFCDSLIKSLFTDTSESPLEERYWAITAKNVNNFAIRNIRLDVLGGILIGNCSGWTLENAAIKVYVSQNLKAAWNTYVYGVTDFRVRNITFQATRDTGEYYLQTDGFHLVGPAKHGVVENLIGTTGDDMVIIQTDKDELYQSGILYPGSSGEVYDITIDGVKTSTYGAQLDKDVIDSTHSLIALLPKQSRMDRVYINDVSGVYDGSMIINFTARYLPEGEYHTDVGYIKLSNFNVRRTIKDSDTSQAGYYPLMIESPDIDTLEFENINIELAQLPGSRIMSIAPSSNPIFPVENPAINIRRLIMKNVSFVSHEDRGVEKWNNSSGLYIAPEVTIRELRVDGCMVEGQIRKGISIYGKMDALRLRHWHDYRNLEEYASSGNSITVEEGAVVGEIYAHDVHFAVAGYDEQNSIFLRVAGKVSMVILSELDCHDLTGDAQTPMQSDSTGNISELSIINSVFRGCNYPTYINSPCGVVRFSDILCLGCKNSMYIANTVNDIFVSGVRSDNATSPVVINSSITPKRVVSQDTAINSNMPSAPNANDMMLKSGDIYMFKNGTTYKIDMTLA